MSPSRIHRAWENPKPVEDGPLTNENFERRWKQLSKRQREILILRHAGGLTIDEIAERLFLTRNTVKSHVCYARAKLGGEAQRKEGITVIPFFLGRMIERDEWRSRLLVEHAENCSAIDRRLTVEGNALKREPGS